MVATLTGHSDLLIEEPRIPGPLRAGAKNLVGISDADSRTASAKEGAYPLPDHVLPRDFPGRPAEPTWRVFVALHSHPTRYSASTAATSATPTLRCELLLLPSARAATWGRTSLRSRSSWYVRDSRSARLAAFATGSWAEQNAVPMSGQAWQRSRGVFFRSEPASASQRRLGSVPAWAGQVR